MDNGQGSDNAARRCNAEKSEFGSIVCALSVGIVTGIPAETRGLSNEPKKSPNG
jgi:hypothetical protein